MRWTSFLLKSEKTGHKLPCAMKSATTKFPGFLILLCVRKARWPLGWSSRDKTKSWGTLRIDKSLLKARRSSLGNELKWRWISWSQHDWTTWEVTVRMTALTIGVTLREASIALWTYQEVDGSPCREEEAFKPYWALPWVLEVALVASDQELCIWFWCL